VNSKNEIERRPGHRLTGRAFRVAAIDRVADRIDLAIDLLTLGQYGLECRETGAATHGCEGSKLRTRFESGIAWEAPRASRRRGCEWPWPPRPASSRPRA
jgi:hypothetical protein